MNHVLRITGSSELPEPLLMDNDYLFNIRACVNKIEKRSDENGEATFTYSARQLTCEILKKNGEILKTKDKTKQSAKLRLAILGYQQLDKPDEDSEKYYERIMGSVRHFLPEVIELTKKLDEKA